MVGFIGWDDVAGPCVAWLCCSFSDGCSLTVAEARKGYVGGAPVALVHVAETLCVSGVMVEVVFGYLV